jgi:hypothetical protein
LEGGEAVGDGAKRWAPARAGIIQPNRKITPQSGAGRALGRGRGGARSPRFFERQVIQRFGGGAERRL